WLQRQRLLISSSSLQLCVSPVQPSQRPSQPKVYCRISQLLSSYWHSQSSHNSPWRFYSSASRWRSVISQIFLGADLSNCHFPLDQPQRVSCSSFKSLAPPTNLIKYCPVTQLARWVKTA